MGHVLFAAVTAGAGPRTSRAAVPLSIAAHAIGVAALIALPLLAQTAVPPVASTRPDAPVLVLPVPPPPAPPPVVRIAQPAARPRALAPRDTPAPVAPAPTVAVPTVIPSDLPRPGDAADLCLGCVMTLTPPSGGLPGPGSAGTPGGGEGRGTGPVRIGGHIRTPLKLRHVDPEYPPLARAARVEGRVVVECVIDSDGRVAEARVVSGKPLLDAAALEAVRQWRYRPTLLDGVAVAVQMTVTVEFHLR